MRPDPAGQGETVLLARHVDVAEHDVDRNFRCFEDPDGLPGVGRLMDPVAAFTKELRDHVPDEDLVLDDEDRLGRASGGRSEVGGLRHCAHPTAKFEETFRLPA